MEIYAKELLKQLFSFIISSPTILAETSFANMITMRNNNNTYFKPELEQSEVTLAGTAPEVHTIAIILHVQHLAYYL